MPYDLSKVDITDRGIQIGNGSFVNPNFLSQSGYDQAVNYKLGKDVVKGEPTILSSFNGRQNFDTKIQPVIDQARQNISTANDINNRSISRTREDARASGIPEDLLGELRDGETPTQFANRKKYESFQNQIEDEKRNLDTLVTLQTSQANALKNTLTSQWNQRINESKQATERGLRDWQTIFNRGGQSRYSPGATTNFLTDFEQRGTRLLREYDTEYANKVQEIDSALARDNYSLAANYSKTLRELEEKSNTLLSDMVKESTKANAQSTRDSAIADLLDQGITDPKEMINLLNFDDFGNQTGDFTAEEIKKTLEALTYKVSGSKDLDKLSGDVRDYFILKDMGALPSDIDNPFEYIRQKSAAGREPKKGGIDTPTGLPGIADSTSKNITRAIQQMKFASVADREAAESNIRGLLLEGDQQGAQEALLQYARNSFSDREREVVQGYDNGLTNLSRLEDSLTRYVNAGGSTDIFKGLMTKALNKIGLADTDEVTKKAGTSLSKIANDISLAIIAYRRAVSGAAFTESEGKAYQDVFPSIGNSNELNSAKIQSLREQFNSDRQGYYKSRISGFDKIFGEEAKVTPVVPAKDQVKSIYQKAPGLQSAIDKMVADGLSWDIILQAVQK